MEYAYHGHPLHPVVEIYPDVVPFYGGISMKEFTFSAEKCARSWRMANEAIADEFGGRLPSIGPALPPVGYVHLDNIGGEIMFPENGESNIRAFADSIEDAIELMKNEPDVTQNKHFLHFLEMKKEMEELCPGHRITLHPIGCEGPLSECVLMRSPDFLCDLVEDPDLSLEFINLMTDSVISYTKQLNISSGLPETLGSWDVYDDLAALFSPSMWSTHVIPAWRKMYEELNTPSERRFLHCENTYPAQLPYLKEAGITFYQPSVSQQLTIENIRENTDIEFDWLLYAFDVVNMSDEQIQEWVDEVVAKDVSIIRTQFGRYAAEQGKLDRIHAFLKAFDKYKVD